MKAPSQNSIDFLGESRRAMSEEVPSAVRAVIYARVSSLAQRDRHTISSQLATLPTFVSLRGWKLAKPPETYLDDGHTAKAGFLSQRLSFSRLLQDAARGEFDVVVVVDLDRLTRSEDLQERGEVLGAFQRAGVQIAVASTGQVLDLRSSMGDLMSSLGAFFAAEENRKRRDRICRGKDEAVRKGRKPAGPTPFGYLYDRERSEWSIDPDLGPIVVEIFTRISRGETCDAVARDLQARGVPRARASKSGRRKAGVWTRERVHQIVRAPTYLGRWIANKQTKASVPVPDIVSHSLWQNADTALRRAGRRGQPRNPHLYLLQGIATCGLCGSRIGCASTGAWATSQGKRRNFYYVCSKRRRPPSKDDSCSLPMLRSELVDARLWEAIVDTVIHQDHLEQALLSQSAEEPEATADPAAELRRLENKLRQLIRAEEILVDRLRRGLLTEEVLDRELVRLAKDRSDATQSMDRIRRTAQSGAERSKSFEAIRSAAHALRERLRIATMQDRRDIVRAIVAADENPVRIGPSRIEASVMLAPRGGCGFAQEDVAG